MSLATELRTADVPVAAVALSGMGPPGEILGGFSFLHTAEPPPMPRAQAAPVPAAGTENKPSPDEAARMRHRP
jgi:hypothetical protein